MMVSVINDSIVLDFVLFMEAMPTFTKYFLLLMHLVFLIDSQFQDVPSCNDNSHMKIAYHFWFLDFC